MRSTGYDVRYTKQDRPPDIEVTQFNALIDGGTLAAIGVCVCVAYGSYFGSREQGIYRLCRLGHVKWKALAIELVA